MVDAWDGGSWGPWFIRQFNDWETEDVDSFLGGCITTSLLRAPLMTWFGWGPRMGFFQFNLITSL